MKFSMRQKIALGTVAFLAVVLIVLNIVVGMFADILSAAVCGTHSKATAKEIEQNYKDGTLLAEEIEGEGLVLAQNNDGVLPLSKDVKKVNVFGWSSTQWVYGGSGSGQCVTWGKNIYDALDDYNVAYNDELPDMYRKFCDKREYASKGALNSYNYQFSRLYEPSVKDSAYYTEAMLGNALYFSDTAIVVIGRVSGESNDCPKAQYKVTKRKGEVVEDKSRTYLEISAEEEELLTYVGANYKNVIVLVNSTNTMELGFMETIEGLDACMIVGGTGTDAVTAVVKAIYGDINPSGKTVDTYAYELETNASYANAATEGEGVYTNSSDGMYPYMIPNANVGDSKAKYEGVYYVDYVEDIYVGYKWYETADVEGYWADVDNKYGKGYDGVVQYPFGFGMSYTSFEKQIVETTPADGSSLGKDDRVTVKVRVKNTGSVAGKEAVELYYTAPYTKGGIEKSAAELVAFAKTKLLTPGEETELTLSFRVYDMASYDCYDKNGNGFRGYEVEASEEPYIISLRDDAHRVADSAELYVKGEGFKYSEDPDTGKTVKNRFTGEDAEDGVAIDGKDSNGNIKFLTRSDFAGTFPKEKASNRAMTDNVKKYNLYTEDMAMDWIDPDDKPIKTGQKNGMVVYDENGITELGLKLGRDYNADEWNGLLEQLTVKEMEELCAHLYLMPNVKIPSIGKYKPFEADGPTMIGSFNVSRKGTGFPMPTVLAQTWNKELVKAFGSHVALEAANLGYDGWYAPGINIHRTPFGGRNYEYYSEDDLLTGEMCSIVVGSALDRGVYCYIKHFVGYDQDGNRDSLYTWLTEQALREMYLKPFEIAVKSGATGLMSSYNRLGALWTGGSHALNTSVLKDEWEFRGAILTDYCDHPQYVSSDQFLRAGGDQILYGFLGDVAFKYDRESNSYMQALQRSAKNSIYIWLNALARNHDKAAAGEIAPRNLRISGGGWVKPVLIVADVLAWCGLAVWTFFLIRKGIKNVRN